MHKKRTRPPERKPSPILNIPTIRQEKNSNCKELRQEISSIGKGFFYLNTPVGETNRKEARHD